MELVFKLMIAVSLGLLIGTYSYVLKIDSRIEQCIEVSK